MPGRLAILRSLLRAARDPERIGDVAIYKAALLGQRARRDVEKALDPLRDDPSFLRPDIDLDVLARLPADTFGYAYQAFLRDNDLHVLRPSASIDGRLVHRHAFAVRYLVVHDMVHVLTGFDTSWPGEAGVWGFVGGQRYGAGYGIASWLALLVAPFAAPTRLVSTWRSWRAGRRMGRAARLVVAEPLERHLAEPLAHVRARLAIP
jgi:ubiquinone biosynthesis protein COQ4